MGGTYPLTIGSCYITLSSSCRCKHTSLLHKQPSRIERTTRHVAGMASKLPFEIFGAAALLMAIGAVAAPPGSDAKDAGPAKTTDEWRRAFVQRPGETLDQLLRNNTPPQDLCAILQPAPTWLDWFRGESAQLVDLENPIKSLAGITALCWAVRERRMDVAKMALDCGAMVNAECGAKKTTESSFTALHLAAFTGQLELARLLVERGADVNATNIEGFDRRNVLIETIHSSEGELCGFGSKLLTQACRIRHLNGFVREREPIEEKTVMSIAEMLIDHRADINARDSDGQTALHWALQHRPLPIAKMLLDRGADVNAVDARGFAPLHTVAELAGGNINSTDLVLLLLDHGANISAPSILMGTPLHVAANSANIDALKVLIERGADVHAVDREKGYTPLHALLDPRFHFHSSRRGSTSMPGRFRYGSDNRPAMTQLLLDHKSNVSARADDGNTPLHLAAKAGYASIMKMLLDHGADMNAVNRKGQFPIHCAVDGDYLEHFVEGLAFLLDHGADPSAKTLTGDTPLIIAAKRDFLPAVKALLKRGVDVKAKDREGHDALHYARDRLPTGPIVKLLEQQAAAA